MFFNENLKFLTKNTEINQNQLAIKLGITRQAITTLLATKDPRASTLIKLSEIYNISIDKLLLIDIEKEGI